MAVTRVITAAGQIIEYERRRPEESVFYKIVQEQIQTLFAHAASQSEHGFGWAELVRFTFLEDLKVCPKCGGAMLIIAVIGAVQTDVISKIMNHLRLPIDFSELRGRFARKGWKKAIEQIYDKIDAGSPIENRVGVIFAPRTSAHTSASDVLIVDPPAEDPVRDSEAWALRLLLLHYAPLFEAQGFLHTAWRLREIAEFDESDFAEYLRIGDEVLRHCRFGRASLTVGEITYKGTFWDATAAPGYLQFRRRVGVYFWGVWQEVIATLTEGRLWELVRMRSGEGVLRGEVIRYDLFDDASLMA